MIRPSTGVTGSGILELHKLSEVVQAIVEHFTSVAWWSGDPMEDRFGADFTCTVFALPNVSDPSFDVLVACVVHSVILTSPVSKTAPFSCCWGQPGRNRQSVDL